MFVEQQSDQLLVWAPAKVNLYLEVLGKRNDGYHELETLMVAVRLFDTLIFKEEPSGKINLHCSDRDLSQAENLVTQAANLLRQSTGCTKGADIHLTKRIPMAAGLGGGSSDGAAALIALNQLWQLGLSDSKLEELASQLGSDLNFFFHLPAAWCTGRGEKVRPLSLRKPLWLVIVKPPVGLATGQVFGALQLPQKPKSGNDIQAALQQGNPEEIGRLLHNRLQPAAEMMCPVLSKYSGALAKQKPAGHLLSGSGTSWFALCRDHREALRIAHDLRHDDGLLQNTQVYVVRSCT